MPKADRKKKAGTENRDRISNTATSHRLGVGLAMATEPT